MNNLYNFKLIAILTGIFSLIFAAGISSLAWVEPSGTAPGNNIATPITPGSIAQIKTGSIGFGDGAIFGANYSIDKIGDSLIFKSSSGEPVFYIDQAGNVGIGTTAPAYKLEVIGGNIKGDQLCIGTDCRDQWPTDILSEKSCMAGTGMVGIDGSGNLVCSGNNYNSFTAPCGAPLPTGRKKIFVTSNIFNTAAATTEAAADAVCQQAAVNGGISGTFKALTYMGSRNPNQAIPSGRSYWNGEKVGSECVWRLVAYSPGEMFADNGDGNYLQGPITFDEYGISRAGNGVWTSFRPVGLGNYDLLRHDLMTCHSTHASTQCVSAWQGGCYYRGTASPPNSSCSYYKEASHWYGIAGYANVQWAYNSWCSGGAGYSNPSWTNCFNSTRSFYCVEQ